MILSGNGIIRSLALSALLLAFSAPLANASECDELSSDPDVIHCWDFDDLSDCSGGREETCYTDNGFTVLDLTSMVGMSIKAGGAYGGGGYLKGVSVAGGTDVGYTEKSISPGATTVNYRWAVRYSDGYMTYNLPHGPGIQTSNGTCNLGGTTEISQFDYQSYHTVASCSAVAPRVPIGDSFLIQPNTGSRPEVGSDCWNILELQQVMDTNGTNGQYRFWVNGELQTLRTNINWGGTQIPANKFNAIWGPRHYYHVGWPRHTASLDFDNFVVKVGMAAGSQIGAYASENARGTCLAPQYADSLGEPYLQRHWASDCSTPGGHKNIRDAIQFRTSATIVSTPVLSTGIEDECSGAAKKSLQTAVTNGNGSGYYWSKPTGGGTAFLWPHWVVQDWIYLPDTNSYATATPLSGWIDYQNVPANGCSDLIWANYLTACVTTSETWGICTRACATSGTQTVIDSGVAITENQFTGIQLYVDDDRLLTFDLNETGDPEDWETIIDAQALPLNVDYLFDSSGSNGPFIGVVNYAGAGTFTAYHADSAAASASLWDCKGWDANCPYEQAPPDPCDVSCGDCSNEAACDASDLTCYWWITNSCNASPEPEPTTPKGTALINWLRNKYPAFKGLR